MNGANGAAAEKNGAREIVLTDAQRAVLQWVAHGKTSQEIALLMNLESPGAVDAYLKRIYDKVGCYTRAAAVAWGLRRGVIS